VPQGLGQDVSSADEIGIARVIACDTPKHLSLTVAPIILTTAGHVREVPLGSTAIGKTRLSDTRHSIRPVGRKGGGFAQVLASGLGFASLQTEKLTGPR